MRVKTGTLTHLFLILRTQTNFENICNCSAHGLDEMEISAVFKHTLETLVSETGACSPSGSFILLMALMFSD